MSYFDDASLVMIPSGYKDQKVYSVKPLDGSGDLTFSRASSATRVASNGLIEKVRTNVVLYSNTFSSGWALTNSSVTGGQAGYDGTNNAWLASKSSGYGRVEQNIGTTGLETFSVYVKAGSSSYVDIASSEGPYVGVNLTNGSIVAQSGVTTVVTSAGNGYYRISIAYTKASTSALWRIIIGDAGSTSSSAGSTGTILIQNAQAETGDIATQYIATTSAAVSVGPVSGLPRLDYLNSTCPRLLLEPQRTNLAQYSEQMDNAAWGKNGVTVTANAAVSPDGYTNADKIVETATTGPHGLAPTYSMANSTTYTFSVFAKKAENDYVIMNIYTGVTSTFTSFNVANGTIGTTGVGATAKIENYGNGWYRCMLTVTTAATGSPNIFMWTARANDAIEYTGNGVNGTFMYGCVLEAGAYATSYIPTLGTSVTRVSDAASKTGISSLIGQTEGTLFVELDFKHSASGDTRIFSIWNAANDEVVSLWATAGSLRYQYYDAGTSVNVESSTVSAEGVHKLALAYNGTSFKAYKDGTVILDTTMAAAANLNCSVLGFAGFWGSSVINHQVFIKQALLFKTQLTNAQLAELTTL